MEKSLKPFTKRNENRILVRIRNERRIDAVGRAPRAPTGDVRNTYWFAAHFNICRRQQKQLNTMPLQTNKMSLPIRLRLETSI